MRFVRGASDTKAAITTPSANRSELQKMHGIVVNRSEYRWLTQKIPSGEIAISFFRGGIRFESF